MQLFDLIALSNPNAKPLLCKIHLATWNGEEDPLDVYLASGFDEWQKWQAKRNFERKYVISLISLPTKNQWLFVGLYQPNGAEWKEDRNLYYYDLCPDLSCLELQGRLIVSFVRTGRQPYLYAEKWAHDVRVVEIRAEKLSIVEFPGFREVNLSMAELNSIVNQSLESWRVALSNVAGIYVISDTATGKLYVGSASGQGGIWQRWSQYANTGHGGNKELRALLGESEAESAEYFRFAILEVADIHSSEKDILQRESHWKKILLSREYGYNAN